MCSSCANESINKYKLLSAYGGPGSLIHTQHGSIMVSSIEEWGFLKKVLEIRDQIINNPLIRPNEKRANIIHGAADPINGNISVSNDDRLLETLKNRKGLQNLEYLVLFPDIELVLYNNKVKDEKAYLTVPSTFIPKMFFDRAKNYLPYKEWFRKWCEVNNATDQYGEKFSPPKKNWYVTNGQVQRLYKEEILTQDNLVLICNNGHLSDFPWSQFLRWRIDNPNISLNQEVDLFDYEQCCGNFDRPTAKLRIVSSSGNSSGFDGKRLKCDNCSRQTTLKGIMSLRIKCPGHKPWEVATGEARFYSGDRHARENQPPWEQCTRTMKVALTTGNNLYYYRGVSSIYLPNELFLTQIELDILDLEARLEQAMEVRAFRLAEELNAQIGQLKSQSTPEGTAQLTDDDIDTLYKYQEYHAFKELSVDRINVKEKFLKVNDVTEGLHDSMKMFFDRILSLNKMKITSTQLDFTRVEPFDPTSVSFTKNIYRSRPEEVIVYPAIESYGEGIFISFDANNLIEYERSEHEFIERWRAQLSNKGSDPFSQRSVNFARQHDWRLYLIHTFSHLIMRELEFKCGYPTASLSERIYISNTDQVKMYGCLIYTAEGAEGSMGGLIAQAKGENLNNLLRSALKRATICHSDPLCWESNGQGLFELNFASCFSCGLVSETSCELRNIYLDRRLLVDENSGLFKNIINAIG